MSDNIMNNSETNNQESYTNHPITNNKTNQINKEKKVNSEKIDLSMIIWESLNNNKLLFVSIVPLFIGYYLQDTMFTRSIAKVTSNIPEFISDVNINKILLVLLPFLCALVLFYVSNTISTKVLAKIELESISKLTEQLIESIKTTKKQIDVNDLMIHIKKIHDTKNIYTIVVSDMIPTFIVAFSIIYMFLSADLVSGLIVICVLVAMVFITTQLELNSIDNAYKTEEASNTLFDEIHEVITNIDSVITGNTKDYEIENVEKKKDNTYLLSCISESNNINTTYGLQLISLISMLGLNFIAYMLYTNKQIDLVTLTSTVLLSLLFMDYYNYSVRAVSDLIEGIGRFTETRDYFYDFSIDTLTDAEKLRLINLKTIKGDIIFKSVTLNYENKSVFNNFNLEIKGGTTIGLLGPIGSGKSTMMKMIAGIIDYEGEILIDGQDLKQSTYESIVEHIAYIPQHPKLFNRTVLYNINYGSSYTKEEIVQKLDALGLSPFINSLADKLDTVVGKEGKKLSGGQKQFVALIRAIIQNKKILLLDEPTSSLDATNKQLFMTLIKNIKDKTIIISTHDKQIMQMFDRIVNIGQDAEKEKNEKLLKKSVGYTQTQYDVEYYS